MNPAADGPSGDLPDRTSCYTAGRFSKPLFNERNIPYMRDHRPSVFRQGRLGNYHRIQNHPTTQNTGDSMNRLHLPASRLNAEAPHEPRRPLQSIDSRAAWDRRRSRCTPPRGKNTAPESGPDEQSIDSPFDCSCEQRPEPDSSKTPSGWRRRSCPFRPRSGIRGYDAGSWSSCQQQRSTMRYGRLAPDSMKRFAAYHAAGGATTGRRDRSRSAGARGSTVG